METSNKNPIRIFPIDQGCRMTTSIRFKCNLFQKQVRAGLAKSKGKYIYMEVEYNALEDIIKKTATVITKDEALQYIMLNNKELFQNSRFKDLKQYWEDKNKW